LKKAGMIAHRRNNVALFKKEQFGES